MAMKAGAHEDLKTRLWRFMEAHIYPNEQLFLTQQREIGEASNEWYNPPILVSAAPGLALTPAGLLVYTLRFLPRNSHCTNNFCRRP